ncbi:MAG: hypothetical protein M1426_01765, partial [Patescibacteria group bacterium]|nr:hypothetical protein [Patescibacteria group bacterium]
LAGKQLVAEVNAGNSPIGISLAERLAGFAVVISQDIKYPVKRQIKRRARALSSGKIPDNFYYLTGDLSLLDLSNLSALFSMFPSNRPETLDWLPVLISEALKTQPTSYVGVVTENATGKGVFGLNRLLPKILAERGLEVQVSNLGFNQVAAMFGETEYVTYLQYAGSASLIEINRNRRAQFIGA